VLLFSAHFKVWQSIYALDKNGRAKDYLTIFDRLNALHLLPEIRTSNEEVIDSLIE
jgi:hypothetical protein